MSYLECTEDGGFTKESVEQHKKDMDESQQMRLECATGKHKNVVTKYGRDWCPYCGAFNGTVDDLPARGTRLKPLYFMGDHFYKDNDICLIDGATFRLNRWKGVPRKRT